MPAGVAEGAFEAFFTTTQVGSGTGRGLDIRLPLVRPAGE